MHATRHSLRLDIIDTIIHYKERVMTVLVSTAVVLSLIEGYQRFAETCCPYLHNVLKSENQHLGI